ncbi:MAG: pyrimidine 5'-nucleotidase [Alphaproteobacteria bacterium]|nr:pyrimidine 5'-nucleotidase [Alphaproteobacteria bacterium]
MQSDKLNKLKNVDTWIFDLDKTLYSAETSLFPQIDLQICSFICRKLHMEVDEAFRLQKKYYRKYGTTLQGLINKYGIIPDEFLWEAHQLNLEEIKHDKNLDEALGLLHGNKYIYTNGPRFHAERIIKKLGVASHFTEIFDIKDANYISKPERESYTMMAEKLGIDFNKSAFFEDSYRNLPPASDLGMTTVWVRNSKNWKDERDVDGSVCDFITDSLSEWLKECSVELEEIK